MKNPAFIHPAFALAAWTGLVLLLVALRRIGAAARQEVAVDDFKYGESPAVPAHVGLPNRNYMNLLELPVLFYVACVLLYVAGTAPAPLAIGLAWAYVALRIGHTLVHLTYNHVLHRLAFFAASNGVLVALWVCAWLAVERAASI
ncbi:MAG: hypothetical protein EPO01_11800 [Aquabacterium sp.]|nr:MAG: hypothetical protein EPO01_11800 [Aquabacterium sp.]